MQTTPSRFRKRPIVIEAMQYTAPNQPEHGSNIDQLQEWGAQIEPTEHWGEENHPARNNVRLFVAANGDFLEIVPDEWIIRDSLGFYPCQNAKFAETYEPVED